MFLEGVPIRTKNKKQPLVFQCVHDIAPDNLHTVFILLFFAIVNSPVNTYNSIPGRYLDYAVVTAHKGNLLVSIGSTIFGIHFKLDMRMLRDNV